MNSTITYNKVSQIQHQLKQALSKNAGLKLNSICYGYGCPKNIDDDINSQTILLESLQRIKNGLYYNAMCLCNEDIQSIIEKSICHINLSRCTDTCPEVSISKNNMESWTLHNPNCVSYDYYEKYAKEFCGSIGLTVSIIQDDSCDLVDLKVSRAELDKEEICNDLEVRVSRVLDTKAICDIALSIKKEVLNCDILLSATAYTKACETNLKVVSTTEQCRIDHNLMIEKGYTIEYKDYKNLIKKGNVSYEMVQSVYALGNILFLGSDGEVVLKTPYSEHIFSDLCANTELLTSILPSTTTISQLLKDYK